MPRLTALIHTHNDELRLGRALESLRPCDELLVFDDGSRDGTAAVAREYGARVLSAMGTGLAGAQFDWILCLLPSEALSEALEASLFEWKLTEHAAAHAFSMAVREQDGDKWLTHPATTRLLNRQARSWTSPLPPDDLQAQILAGDLLRFQQP
jgi:cellulose synthase/poly-beta-1,6-N-acetylglucosamine synthase-like glycosyltransferase